MANHDQSAQHTVAPSAPTPLPTLSRHGAARRRMAGLGVSGVLMTVASAHGMADDMCKSPSGALSGDLHNSHAPEQVCELGADAKYWYDNRNLLSELKIDHKTKFKAILPTHRSFGEQSVHNVLQGLGNQGTAEVPRLMLATYFNVVVEPRMINFLTKQAVLDMWANYNDDEQYNHSGSNKTWDSWQFANYLRGTQSPT